MRQPRPYFRSQRGCWYVQIGKKQIRLSKDKEEAWNRYHQIMVRRGNLSDDPMVSEVLESFQAWSEDNHEESTQKYYADYQKSFWH